MTRSAENSSAEKKILADVKSSVELILRLEQEREAIDADIADLYRDAEAAGINSEALREVVRVALLTDAQREFEKEERAAFKALRNKYLKLADVSE